MMQHHKYSLTELEGMIPWERDIYINLLMQHLEEERERQKQEAEYAKEEEVAAAAERRRERDE